MTVDTDRRSPSVPVWAVLLIAVIALVIATAALTAALVGPRSPFASGGFGMIGRNGMMRGAGMMGGAVPAPASGPGPGQSGFAAGTKATPRVVRIYAGPGYAFEPSTVRVVQGETITFEVTTMGPLVHEFMVGPAGDVAADKEGTPEVADIGMIQTGSVRYTFDGPGPFAFACHAPGHYEAGMKGTIVVQ